MTAPSPGPAGRVRSADERGAGLASVAPQLSRTSEPETTVDILLIIAVIVILLALLGFTGIVAALRTAAWLILVIGIVILVLALIF